MTDTQNEYRIVGYLGPEYTHGEPAPPVPRPIHKSIPTKELADHALLAAQLTNLEDGRYRRILLQERTLTDWQ